MAELRYFTEAGRDQWAAWLEDLKADLAGIHSVFYTELKEAPNSSLIALMRWKAGQ